MSTSWPNAASSPRRSASTSRRSAAWALGDGCSCESVTTAHTTSAGPRRTPGRRLAGVVHVFPRDEHFMRLALDRAAAAGEHGDVPVGAVVVRDGEVVGAAGNERELRADPTAHAECLALREAALTLGGWRLLGTVLYCTLEPCPMCAGAIQQARVHPCPSTAPPTARWAPPDRRGPAANPRLIHRVEVTGGSSRGSRCRSCSVSSTSGADRAAGGVRATGCGGPTMSRCDESPSLSSSTRR